MTLARIIIDCTLDSWQYEQILDSIAIGINDWAETADIVCEDDEDKLPYFRVKPKDDPQTYIVTKTSLQYAIRWVLEDPASTGFSVAAREDLIKCIVNEITEEIDPQTAQQLAQVAFFHEVIYG